VQYQPLSGAALIAQLGTPITIESLGNLFNSDWPLVAVLTLIVDRLTPGYSDYSAAINALSALDAFGAITLSPGVMEIDPQKSAKANKGLSPAAKNDKDSSDGKKLTYPILTVSFQPHHPDYDGKFNDINRRNKIIALWCRLQRIMDEMGTCNAETGTSITFRVGQIRLSRNNTQIDGVQVFTRSAYGVLKSGVETPWPRFEFLDKDKYYKVKPKLNSQNCGEFYILPPELVHDVRQLNPDLAETKAAVTRTIENAESDGCLYT
jgi:hypothetical protein